MQSASNKINGHVLNPDVLLPGDIILSTTNELVSKVVRKATNSNYSHTMLYVGGNSCIDSTNEGVQSHNTQRILFSEKSHCRVLRMKNPLTDEQLSVVINFVRTKIGMQYSVPEAIRVKNNLDEAAQESNRQFCSRLIAQAFNTIGLLLVKNPDYTSPEEISKSKLLGEVSNALKEASEHDLVSAAEKNTSIDKINSAHNYILEEARKRTGYDIQTFEQLNGYLLMYPKHDEIIKRILVKSDYLNLWKEDIVNNPWFYNYEIFTIVCPEAEEQKKIGNENLSYEKDTKRRHEIALEFLQDLFMKCRLESYRLQVELEENLIELSETRLELWEALSRK